MPRSSANETYRGRLRSIGDSFDSGGFHSMSILEVDGGLIVRATAPGERTPQVIEIANGDVADLAAGPLETGRSPHRLFPSGYGRFLAALGARLDQGNAAAISIVEGTDFVTVGGIQPVSETADGVAFEPLDILLLPDDIREISQRPAPAPQVTSPRVARSAARNPQSRAAGQRTSWRLSGAIRSFLGVCQFN